MPPPPENLLNLFRAFLGLPMYLCQHWPPHGDCLSLPRLKPLEGRAPTLFQNSHAGALPALKYMLNKWMWSPLALRRAMVFVVRTRERQGYIHLMFLVCSSTMCLPELVFVSYIISSLESSEEIAEREVKQFAQVTQLISSRAEPVVQMCLCLLAFTFLPS